MTKRKAPESATSNEDEASAGNPQDLLPQHFWDLFDRCDNKPPDAATCVALSDRALPTLLKTSRTMWNKSSANKHRVTDEEKANVKNLYDQWRPKHTTDTSCIRAVAVEIYGTFEKTEWRVRNIIKGRRPAKKKK